jgi:glycosyltransferase involved in cell wall biosynthesis
MSPTLSVVMPVYNEASHLAATIRELLAAIERSDFDAELVVVDDGSTDGTAAVATEASAGRIPLQVLVQPNRGRFEARRAGLEAAQGKLVLLLDGRLTLAADALGFLEERVAQGEQVWTGHVEVGVDGNPYAVFWKLLAELAWEDYFADPRTTRFDASNFDRFPKGTGCFLAPRQLLLDAVAAFRSRYSDSRYANDDTPLIRWIAEREPIHVSPHFSGVYVPRTRLQAFLRHSFRRGTVFLDGHGRSESRFFWLAVGFYPASALIGLAAVRRPVLIPLAAAAVAVGAGALAVTRRRAPFEIASLALLAPVYAVAHGAGMWRGLGLIMRDRLSGARRS